MSEISVERLHELFQYCPDTGHLTRRIRRAGQPAGAQVGCPRGSGSYLVVGVDYKHCYVHRAVFAMYTGAWPPAGMQVDHINRNKQDNRAVNLRLVTPQGNTHNALSYQDKENGLPNGVRFMKRKTPLKKPYQAYINLNSKFIHLGCFATAPEAHARYCEARRDMHPTFEEARCAV